MIIFIFKILIFISIFFLVRIFIIIVLGKILERKLDQE